MRKPIFFIAGCIVTAIAVAQVSTSTMLTSFSKAINDAKSVTSDYTFQTINSGGAQDYSVTLKKPNMARVESPTQLVIADGKEVTTYDKNEKTYYKQPQTDVLLKGMLGSEEVHLWAGFFDAKAYNAVRSKDLGNRSVKGGTLAAVEAAYDAHDRKVVTYFVDPADNMARKEQIELDKKDPGRTMSMIVSTKSLTLNGAVPDSAFVFTPPADSREMSLAEINAGKWYYDLDEAMKVAKASNKKIFVDFYATWCGPCKLLEQQCFGTDEFKKFGSKLVFCRIDVDDQASVAAHYGIEAMPTQDILDKDGNVLNQTVGYANPEMFFQFLRNSTGG